METETLFSMTVEQQQRLLTGIDWQKQQDLVPVVVQNYYSAKVLMLGYMNQEALQTSFDKQLVTFFSRSKQRLWTKGESSGNHLQLVSVAMDCDNDTLLIQAVPVGPTCHTGSESCWNTDDSHPFIHQLETLIHGRKNADPASSYTASLFARGTKRISQKVGEEGLETALAAATHDKEELVNEASDLIYHLLVLLEDQEMNLAKIHANLDKRHRNAK